MKLMADVAPGVVADILNGPDEEERQPAELDVAADAVFPMVEHRTESECALHVAPAPLDFEQLLVGEGEVRWGEAVVGGAQQALAVERLLACDGGLVDAEPSFGESSQQSLQRRRGAQSPASSSRLDFVQLSVPSIWVSE